MPPNVVRDAFSFCYLSIRSMLGVSTTPNTPQTLCTKAFPAIYVRCLNYVLRYASKMYW